jgi:hypothetical protein
MEQINRKFYPPPFSPPLTTDPENGKWLEELAHTMARTQSAPQHNDSLPYE